MANQGRTSPANRTSQSGRGSPAPNGRGSPGPESSEAIWAALSAELEQKQEEMLRVALALFDEEDAVLLYRCSDVAQRAPELLAAMVERRKTMQAGLECQVARIWKNLGGVAQASVASLNSFHDAASRAAANQRGAALQSTLDITRKSAAVMQKHAMVEKDFAVKDALQRLAGDLASQHAAEMQAAKATLEVTRVEEVKRRTEIVWHLSVANTKLAERDADIKALQRSCLAMESLRQQLQKVKSEAEASRQEFKRERTAEKESTAAAEKKALLLETELSVQVKRAEEVQVAMEAKVAEAVSVAAAEATASVQQELSLAAERAGPIGAGGVVLAEEMLRAELRRSEESLSAVSEQLLFVMDEAGIDPDELAAIVAAGTERGRLEVTESGAGAGAGGAGCAGGRVRGGSAGRDAADGRRRRGDCGGGGGGGGGGGDEGVGTDGGDSRSEESSGRVARGDGAQGALPGRAISERQMQYLADLAGEVPSMVEADLAALVASPKLKPVAEQLKLLMRTATSAEEATRRRWVEQARDIASVAKSTLRPLRGDGRAGVGASAGAGGEKKEAVPESADPILDLLNQLRLKTASCELQLRAARASQLELANAFPAAVREQIAARSLPIQAALEEARLADAATIMARELGAVYEKLEGERAEATAQQARAEDPGNLARHAQADLLGKCTELEKLLGLRERQLINLVLNALAERKAALDRLAANSDVKVTFVPITGLKGTSYGKHAEMDASERHYASPPSPPQPLRAPPSPPRPPAPSQALPQATMNASMPHLVRASSSGTPAVSGGYAGSPYAGSPLTARIGAGQAGVRVPRAVTATPASRPAATSAFAQPRFLYSAPSSDLPRASSDGGVAGGGDAVDVARLVPSILRTAAPRLLHGSASTPVLPRVNATRPQTVPAPVAPLSPLSPQRGQASSRSGPTTAGAVHPTSPTRRFAYSKAAGLDMQPMHGHNGLFVVPTMGSAAAQMGDSERVMNQLDRLLRARSQAAKGGLS